MAASRIDRFFIFSAGILLLGFLLSACSSGPTQDPRLPDFPEYMPAEKFLILQKRLERYKKRPRVANPPPRFNDRKRHIYKMLEQQQALAKGELENKARQKKEFEELRNIQAGQNFESYRGRLAQAEIDRAQREEEINKIAGGTNRERYVTYQKNLASKRLEQQAIEFLRAQESRKIIQRNAARIPQKPFGGISVSPLSGGSTTQ